MRDHRRRVVLSSLAVGLLAAMLLSTFVLPELYGALAGSSLPVLETVPAEPRPGRVPGITELGADAPFPLPLNSATAEELALVPQVGGRAAALIVTVRELYGGFESVDQLGPLLGLEGEALDRLGDYLVPGVYSPPGALPDGFDADAEVDRIFALLAAEVSRTDLDDPAALDALLAQAGLFRTRLVELIGEAGLAGRSDFDELLLVLGQRRDRLAGAGLSLADHGESSQGSG